MVESSFLHRRLLAAYFIVLVRPHATFAVLIEQSVPLMGNRATSILGLWVLGSTLLGLMIGHQFIYRQLVLPRLSEFVSIPISWWAIVLSPLSLLWLSTGFAVQSFKQSLLAASVGATVVQGYLGACTVLHQPGFTKSLATEAPGLFWFQGTIVVWVVIVFFVTMGLLAKKLWGQHSP